MHFLEQQQQQNQEVDYLVSSGSDITTLPSTSSTLMALHESDVSGPPPLYWSWGETMLSIPLTLIVVGTIIGNFLVLYSFATRSRTLRSPTHFFIANLALADFLVGILVMPFLATLQLTKTWYFGQPYCTFWTVIHFWLCSASILSTCAVCIERYVGVAYPLNHRDIMNPTRVGGLVAGVWILAGILSLTSIFAWPQPYDGEEYSCRLNQQIGHVIVAVVFILYIPAAIMIILYLRIYVIATRHLSLLKKKSLGSGSVPLSSSDATNADFKYKKVKDTPKQGSLESGRIQPIVDSESSSGVSVNYTSASDVEGSSVVIGSSSENPKKSISSTPKNSTNTGKEKTYTEKQIALAKRLSLLVGILLVSYVPFFTLYMVMAFHPGSINGDVFSFFGWIRYFNSCLNPIIYAFAVPAYRKALTDIVCMGKCWK